ncbi:hypothetical protein V1512DRAFT_261027 [Lipomyces arxii]|uniref:uncharacterized protein n=1 Tax=Lipomyces arxii TaxID=56418 RepID=UPI0034CD155F
MPEPMPESRSMAAKPEHHPMKLTNTRPPPQPQAKTTRPTVSSRLLAPTAASRNRAQGVVPTETRVQIKVPRASAPPALTNARKPVSSVGPKRAVRQVTVGSAPSFMCRSSAPGSVEKPKAAVRTVREIEVAAATVAEAAAARELKRAEVTSADKQRIDELSMELRGCRIKLEGANEVIKQEADKITDLKSKHGRFEQQIARLMKDLGERDDQIAKLRAELESSRSQQENNANLSTKLAGMEERLRQQERELEGNTNVIKSLEEEVKSVGERKDVEKEYSLTKLAESYTGWRDKAYVDSLETQIAEFKKQSDKSDLESSVSALTTQNEMLTEIISSQASKFEQDMAILSGEVARLESQLSIANAKLESVTADRAQVELMFAGLKKPVIESRAVFGDLENVEISSEMKG